ncbi:MAG: TRAP transporter substrate-binding protein [Rhodospirillales bacterium]|nr:TRAP transporter substrate-binding protein [Rhodospirillales bacterium]
MKWKPTIALAAMFAAFTSSVQAADTVLRLGDIIAPTSVQAEATDLFAKTVNSSNVGLEVKTFHAGQLGTGPVQVQNVQLGVQEMFIGGLAFYGGFSDRLKIAETPFSFSGREHFEKWLSSDKHSPLNDVVTAGGQRIINANVPWRRGPFRVMMATKPVLNLKDLSTTKLRLWEAEVANRFWGSKGLGAIPVTIPFGDVYLGLRQGVVDAVTTPFDLITAMKFGEVAKHVMLLRQFPQVLPMSINESKWQSLNKAQQNVLIKAADEAGKFFNDKVNASLEKWTAEIKGMGVTFHDVDTGPFIALIAKRNREWQTEGYWPKNLISDIESLR